MIEGLEKDVSGLAEDKQDSWRAMIENSSLIVLDNLEGVKAHWIPLQLDRISTGQVIEIRQLYKTNEVYEIKPDVFVSITAVSIPFSKATVFERMLILNTEKLNSFIPAHVIENRLRNNIDGMWADLLNKLNMVLPYVDQEVVLAQQVRMADFAMFCSRIKKADVIDEQDLNMAVRALGSSQQKALAESETSAFPMIQEFIEKYPDKASRQMTFSQLYDEIKHMSGGRIIYWDSSRRFGTHLRAIKEVLKAELGAVIEQIKLDSNGKPWDGGKETWCIRFEILGRVAELDDHSPETVEVSPDGYDIVTDRGS
jgi:hypothetical protein